MSWRTTAKLSRQGCGARSTDTYYIACFHVTPSKLFTAAPILNTSDVNQNEFTAFCNGPLVMSNENCIVVAVTAEKNVATVLRFSRF